ncbi:hypothetical protein Ahy_B09g098164 [Arachis hypogaea]|uniref:FAR1 domain-containing protein n=1 Tax=Arachis hypogaea TaxID=3818 RepID=A0A444XR99_ARAHY|nr:hypothetical protein Ahy_B09g098164 [Arachis hypogaea]
MVDMIGESSHNQIENVSAEEMEELLVDSDGNDVENLIGRVNFVSLSVNMANKYTLMLPRPFTMHLGGSMDFQKFKVGGVDETNRKRALKPETRCGCVAQMRVHIDVGRDWWYKTLFQNEHNHELMPPTLS